MPRVKITKPQMSALETAGAFVDDPIASFVDGHYIVANDESSRLICELSNYLDEIGRGNDISDDEVRKWHRRDSVVLSHLYLKMLRGFSND